MKKIAFYPYESSNNEYIVMMRDIIYDYVELVDYKFVQKGLIPLHNIATIYLNWIENDWTSADEKLLAKAKRYGIKIIWVFHNKIPHDTQNKREAERVVKYIIQKSDYIVIHSKASEKYIKEYDVKATKKVVYIPHINYENVYFDYGGDIRKKYGINNNDLVFGLLGMIRPYKNIEVLINIFNRLEMKNAKLFVVGKSCNNSYYRSLEELKKNADNIILKDQYINNIAMKSYLDAIDILILPYNIQSSMNSGVMIMSFSYGKTVIIPKIAMSDEFSDDLIYKYDYDDEESMYNNLYEQIKKVITDGKEKINFKGLKLMQEVCNHNTREIVKRELFKIL